MVIKPKIEPTNIELKKIYKQLTGKRPVYNKKATKGYVIFLDAILIIRLGKGTKKRIQYGYYDI